MRCDISSFKWLLTIFPTHFYCTFVRCVMFGTPKTATKSVACTTSELNKCSRTHYLCSSVVGVNKKKSLVFTENMSRLLLICESYSCDALMIWVTFVSLHWNTFVTPNTAHTETHTVRAARSSQFFTATIRNGYRFMLGRNKDQVNHKNKTINLFTKKRNS